ncbi:sortase domain-bontaining protein [Streptomyces tubercidicus]|uniref:sortase domain-containing protein n=1 Tax=Streptomyces tubercidicus TaxID=47759 RepID=UPI0030DE7510
MSADEEGRAGAVGVTAGPALADPGAAGPDPADSASDPDDGVHHTRTVTGAPNGPGASRTAGTPRANRPHAFPGPGPAPDSVSVANRNPASEPASHRPAQLLTGVAWAVLLLGLWLWGRDLADGVAAQLATTGDVAAAGRPLGRPAPPHAHTPPHAPLRAATTTRPVRITLDALGVREAGITGRGLDGDGVLTAPPYSSPRPVGWYAGGPQPGEAGAALLVARPDVARGPDARRTVFHRLTQLKPGERVDIRRADGSTARFTIEDVQLYDPHRFDPHTAYAAHARGRSELRLIAEDSGDSGDSADSGGSGDTRDGVPGLHGSRAANVLVISAYLTSYQQPPNPGPG